MQRRGVIRATDRQYMYHSLVRLAERFPIEFLANNSPFSRIYEDVRLVAIRLRHTFHRGVAAKENIWTWVPFPADLDVAYAYGQFPRSPPTKVPIVWQQTFAPVEIGVNLEMWRARLRESRSTAVERADRVVVPSDVNLVHYCELFPWAKEKVEVLPYYLPDLEPLLDSQLNAKFVKDEPLRLLFAGKEARRKGLPLMVRAWERLGSDVRRRLDVIVVSEFLDGRVSIPSEWRQFDFVEDLYACMSEADVFVCVTRHEAYGLALVEAMARGCAIITTKAVIQRDIVGEAGGIFIDPNDDSALTTAIETLFRDRVRVEAMAAANVSRFRDRYWHKIVGPEHVRIFANAAGITLGAMVEQSGSNHLMQANPDA